ncbi:MAG: ubiquinol-cytochrome c reductase iron-sulfur subunit [Candidatus Limnocylindria bacterium]
MSNYHVEPVDKPQALTKEAIKSLRKQQVQGLSRRQLMRTALGTAVGLWFLEITAGSIGFVWPNLASGFGGKLRIGTLEDVKLDNDSVPVEEGFPAYNGTAKAFIMLVDPSQQRFIPGEDPTGDGTALNVRALYQRCPHLGCKPNACLRNFWLECPCHGSRYDRLGIKIEGAAYGPATRGMDRFGISVDGDGVLTVDTGRITLGPLPIALGQPGVIPPRTPTGCI